jgi:hypothetical protein
VTVSPAGGGNNPPVAVDDTLTTPQDTAGDVNVLANDSDPDGDALAVTGSANGAHGSVSCPAAGPCTYTPAAGFSGSDSFTYTVSDGRGGTATGNVSVAVIPLGVNHDPVAADDTITTQEGVAGDANVLANDVDPDGDALTITASSQGAHGSVICGGATCTYTPAAGYTGTDSFTYTVSDGRGGTATASVSVTIRAADPPCFPAVCIDNDTVLLAVRPEGHLNVPDGTGSKAGSGPVGLHFIPTGNEATAPGCLCEGWGAADASSGVTGYANETADGGAHNMSVVSFDFTASTAISVVNIEDTLKVTHDYHPSLKTPNLYEVTVTIENMSGLKLGDVRYRRVMDWDVEPTAFSEFVTIDAGTSSELLFDSNNGFASANPLSGPASLGSTGSFVDAGPADHGALFDFGFGGLGAGEKKTFTIFYGAAATEVEAESAVNAVGAEVLSFGQPNTPDGPTLGTPNTFIFAFGKVGGTPVFSPDAVDDNLTTARNTPGSVNVLANDTDPNGDSLTVTTANPTAAHGTVSCTPAGSCTYAPATGYAGPDSFEYSISDGHAGSDTATVHVIVTPDNRQPDAVDDTLTTDSGTAGSRNVLANDSDPDGDTLTVTGNTQGAHGSVSCTAAGSCTYTPSAGFSGSDSFDYAISDGHGGTDAATVQVTVIARRSTSTTYTGATSVQYSDAATLSGTLFDTSVNPSVGIPGKQLDFSLGTQTAHGSPTSGSGNTSTSLVVTQKPGSVTTIGTAFAGDASYLASNDTDSFSITKEDCGLAYSGDTLVAPVTMTRLAADIGESDSSPGDRSNKVVVFTLVDASLATQTFSARTDAGGHATTSVALSQGVYGVSVSFAGDDYYKACSTTEDTLVTVEAAAAKVTGGGWTSIGTGRMSFGFNAIPQAGGVWKGQFQLRSNSGKSKFHADVVSSLSSSGNAATWSGTGRWNGQTGYSYTISVLDNGSSGSKKGDTISITIKSPSNVVVFSTNEPQALKGGNITIHKT